MRTGGQALELIAGQFESGQFGETYRVDVKGKKVRALGSMQHKLLAIAQQHDAVCPHLLPLYHGRTAQRHGRAQSPLGRVTALHYTFVQDFLEDLKTVGRQLAQFTGQATPAKLVIHLPPTLDGAGVLLRVIEGSNFSKHGRRSSVAPVVVIGRKGNQVIHDDSQVHTGALSAVKTKASSVPNICRRYVEGSISIGANSAPDSTTCPASTG